METNGFGFPLMLALTLYWTAALALPTLSDSPETDFYKSCRRNVDCPLNFCCTVGMMRYTMPFCSPMGKLGDPCIPDNERRNFSLSYPNMDSIEVMGSYSLLCPCLEDFYCNLTSTSCEPFEADNITK